MTDHYTYAALFPATVSDDDKEKIRQMQHLCVDILEISGTIKKLYLDIEKSSTSIFSTEQTKKDAKAALPKLQMIRNALRHCFSDDQYFQMMNIALIDKGHTKNLGFDTIRETVINPDAQQAEHGPDYYIPPDRNATIDIKRATTVSGSSQHAARKLCMDETFQKSVKEFKAMLCVVKRDLENTDCNVYAPLRKPLVRGNKLMRLLRQLISKFASTGEKTIQNAAEKSQQLELPSASLTT